MKAIIFFTYFLSFILLKNSLFSQNYFPTINNWEKDQKVSVYDENTLYEYIDGAADAYLALSFAELQVCGYQKDNIRITAEIYRHSDNDFAFGIYAKERPENLNYIKVGAQGYLVDGNLNFFADKFYVKIYSLDISENTLNAIKELADKIAANINPDPKMPEILNLFWNDNKIKNSEKFFGQDFLGLSFLKNAFQCEYLINENKFYVFIIKRNTSDEIQDIIKNYHSFTKQKFTVHPNSVYYLSDPYNGQVFLHQKGNILFGVYGNYDKKFIENKIINIKL